MSLFLGDIGGVPYPPYTTDSQREVAALLAKVSKHQLFSSRSFMYLIVIYTNVVISDSEKVKDKSEK